MTSKRYLLADPGAALPFRGRLFRAQGERMNPADRLTRRLVTDGSIAEVPKQRRPAPNKATKSASTPRKGDK